MNMKSNLMSNILYNALYQVINLVLPIITLPYVARVFNPEIIGVYSYTLSFVQIFILIGGFGTLNYGSRLIATSKDRSDCSRVFIEVWLLQIIASIISFLLLCICICFFMPYKQYFIWQSLLVLVNVFEISWLYIGVQNFKNIAIRNITLKILVTLLTFLLINSPDDIELYILINVLAIFIGNLLMFKYLNLYVNFTKISLNDLKKHIKPAFSLLLPQLVTLVYTTLDKTILGTVSTEVQVGFYEQAQKIIRIAISLLTSVTTVLMPRMTSLIKQGKKSELEQLFSKSLNYIILLSFLIISIIIVVSPDFVIWFYGEDYRPVGTLMILTSIIGFLIPVTVLVGNTILIPFGLEKYVLITATFSALTSGVCNSLFDSFLGSFGACISLILAEGVAFIYRNNFAKRVINFKVLTKDTLQVFVAGLCSIIIGSLSIIVIESNFMSTIVGATIVLISYILILLFLKNSTVSEWTFILYKFIKKN